MTRGRLTLTLGAAEPLLKPAAVDAGSLQLDWQGRLAGRLTPRPGLALEAAHLVVRPFLASRLSQGLCLKGAA